MSGTEYADALGDLKFFGKRLKGVLSLLPELEEMSSLTNTIRQQKDHLEKLKAEFLETQTSLKILKDHIKTFKERADKQQKANAEEHKQILATQEKAQKLARDEAILKVNNEIDELVFQRQSYKKELVDLQKKIDEVKQEYHNQKTNLDETTNALKKLKDSI
jgi:chromosome segregation ATPase